MALFGKVSQHKHELFGHSKSYRSLWSHLELKNDVCGRIMKTLGLYSFSTFICNFTSSQLHYYQLAIHIQTSVNHKWNNACAIGILNWTANLKKANQLIGSNLLSAEPVALQTTSGYTKVTSYNQFNYIATSYQLLNGVQMSRGKKYAYGSYVFKHLSLLINKHLKPFKLP